ncbi:esterase-like activity of phytase family protein [Govanella unica]|uniref:Esterase-like activity of phytase family protein n=1 Tax=Govanella unica TaxID=2975056 RepID=A0A9X3Z5W5_9PROT|nr:esterase-like activity of phytase family protein [Govania unica]MDA5192555.1 esterase-like activity of phytase family protein [Govania unica]
MKQLVVALLMLITGLALAPAEASSPIKTSPEGAATTSPVSFEAIPLNLEDRSKTRVGKLTYLGGLKIKSSDPRLGGLSSLIISEDGSQMLTVSDCGLWVGASLDYTNGQLTGLHNLVISPLLGLKGESLYSCDTAKHNGDAESLTELPGIGLVVGFEGWHRLWVYGATMNDYMMHKLPHPLPLPVTIMDELATLPNNGGIESLTTLKDGRTLVAISEDNPKGGDIVPAWIIGETQISRFSYVASEGFRASDLTTLPDGDLMVLERRLTLMQGLGARLKRIRKEDLRDGKIVYGEEVATLSYPYNIDNMEGIAARTGPDGKTLIYIVSDDNYFPLQRTILMMFRLED